MIVGGGVGGLSTAASLARQGIDVEIVERRTEDFVYGVGIIQPSNALRALKEIGVLQKCLEAGFQSDERRAYDAEGNLLGSTILRRLADPDYGATNYLTRPKLHEILTGAALRAGAKLTLGVTVAELSQDGESVEIQLSDGRRASYDLVIGADGIRSQIRAMLFGSAVQPKFTGHSVWRFTTERPPELTYNCLFYGVGAKAGLVPLSRDLMYLLLVTNEPGNPRLQPDFFPAMLRERLDQFNGLVAGVRGAIKQDSSIVYSPIEEVILPGPWHKGRVVVIGDAAHASSPHLAQGAAMVLEDAVVLGEMVANCGASIEAMLQAFYERRAPRCRYVQEQSRIAGDLGQITDPAACAKRNEHIRLSMASGRPSDDYLEQPI